MTQKTIWRGALVLLLCVALATPVQAQSSGKIVNVGPIIGGAVAGIAGAVIVVVMLAHKKKTITGCAVAGDSGLSVLDEKEKSTYKLSGNTAGIQAGERVSLRGKKAKSKDRGSVLTLQVEKLARDFGPCHP